MAGAALATALLASGAARADEDYERAPIHYWNAPLTDAVTQLKGRLERGAVTLDTSTDQAWLRGVLKELNVPLSSQVMVFSKTSLQRALISPDNPRVLYFSDDVYVGWVPGGGVELSAIDPQSGAIFYLFEKPRRDHGPSLVRSQDCLNCHASPMTRNVPGYMVRSVYPAADGEPILRAGTKLTDDSTPLADRWGGWYVTGRHDGMTHMGNAFAKEAGESIEFDPSQGANLTTLRRFFTVERYPLDQSDIVALMVLEHQVNVHNLLTAASFNVRAALHRQKALETELGLTPVAGLGDSANRIIQSEAERLAKALLFAEEAKLSSEGVTSTSSFTADFEARGPRDSQGRSLRDFRLGGRLFKNRCSYLVYSVGFDGLPAELKERLSDVMREALTGADSRQLAAHIPAEEKQRIVGILRETKPAFAGKW